MRNLVERKSGLWRIVLALTLVCTLLIPGQPDHRAQAQVRDNWVDSGFTLPALEPGKFCFDYNHSNVLYISVNDLNQAAGVFTRTGTFSFNWKTGEKTLYNPNPFSFCDEQGGIFYNSLTAQEAKATRFGPANILTQTVERIPFYAAKDGSRILYSTINSGQGSDFYFSLSDGLSWIKRTPPTTFKTTASLFVAENDSRSVYWLACPNASSPAGCALYYSPNSGGNWEKRANLEDLAQTSAGLKALPGYSVPTGHFLLEGFITGRRSLFYTTDSGKNFKPVGGHFVAGSPGSAKPNEDLSLFLIDEGLLRFSKLQSGYVLEVSNDNGHIWQERTLPLLTSDTITTTNYNIKYIPGTPSAFVLYASGNPDKDMYYTSNGGLKWWPLGSSKSQVLATPYAPTTLLGIEKNKVYTLDLSQVNNKVTLPTIPTGVGGSIFFPETGHNMPPVFRRYWEENGGLYRFGYARTEPFYESSTTDGKVYLVQYFERARFEYNPELAGTKYEVQTGLLGSQLTTNRRANKEFLFNPVPDPKNPDQFFFRVTGHTLKGVFLDYWIKNGGINVFGNPISEELEDTNPDDGKTYVMQYFERARFEYHQESKGTPYEVMLGLLGNAALREKKWLE